MKAALLKASSIEQAVEMMTTVPSSGPPSGRVKTRLNPLGLSAWACCS